MCLLVFGPCVLACLYLVNVPLRVVCFVRKLAGFVETPNSVQRHPESVTTWGLQVEQGSRGVWDRPRQIGFGAGLGSLKSGVRRSTKEEKRGRSSRHQCGGILQKSGTQIIPQRAVFGQGRGRHDPYVQRWIIVKGRL